MKRRRKRTIIWVILILALCVMAFSGHKLWETGQVYAGGDRNYEELAGLVRSIPLFPLTAHSSPPPAHRSRWWRYRSYP